MAKPDPELVELIRKVNAQDRMPWWAWVLGSTFVIGCLVWPLPAVVYLGLVRNLPHGLIQDVLSWAPLVAYVGLGAWLAYCEWRWPTTRTGY